MKKNLFIFSSIILLTSCQLEKSDFEGHWTSVSQKISTTGIRSNGFLGSTIVFRNDSVFAFNSYDFLKVRANYYLRNDSIIIESNPKLSYEISLTGKELKISETNKALNKNLRETYVLNKHDYIIPNERELFRDTINQLTLKNSQWILKDTTEVNFYFLARSKYQHVISKDSSDLKELPAQFNFNSAEIFFNTALSFNYHNETFRIEELKNNTLYIQKVRNDTTWFAAYSGEDVNN